MNAREGLPVHGTSMRYTFDRRLAMRFTRAGERRGVATLLCDGVQIGAGEIASTARYMIGWQGLTIGADTLSPVSWDYEGGFPFSGTLEHVDLVLADDGPPVSHEVLD
jgi:arylsulfatase